VRFCLDLDIASTDKGALFMGKAWPQTITVERGMFEHHQGPYIQAGRRGSLQFDCQNGWALYRRSEDASNGDGWLYRLVSHELHRAA